MDKKPLVRIVKMEFLPEKADDFFNHFEGVKEQIRAFPGCESLTLLRDAAHPEVFFTYSMWTHADALEAYRQSALFKQTWSQVKSLFGKKAVAWSVSKVAEL